MPGNSEILDAVTTALTAARLDVSLLSSAMCVCVCVFLCVLSIVPYTVATEAGHASKAAQIARGAAKRKVSSALECDWDKEGEDLRKIGGSGAAVKNSMRDVIRSMSRLGYSVSVPIRYVPTVYADEGDVQHPVLSLLDMLEFMLKQYSSFLLGGHSLEDAFTAGRSLCISSGNAMMA